jgi:bifunctional UDP-N-acetylglucosamine pyrophosphorylase/glucosamine-1-phosphate N-acetyltransferase
VKAIILAAGQGTRMLPLTKKKPKAMVEVNGKSFLERALQELKDTPLKQIGIIVGFERDKIIKYFGVEWGTLQLEYILQLRHNGTADAIKCARNFVGKEKFVSINGDIIFEAKLINELIRVKGFDVVMVARNSSQPWKYGCLKIKGKKVLDIIEKPVKGKEPSNLVNAGIYLFNSKIFKAIEKIKKSERNEFEITDAIKILAKKGRVGFIKVKGLFYDIGTIKELRKAEKELKQLN